MGKFRFCVFQTADIFPSSVRLIALTFVALVASFGGAFLLLWPLTGALSTPNFVTSMMISTLVSLSLDYSLFLLSHLRVRIPRSLDFYESLIN